MRKFSFIFVLMTTFVHSSFSEVITFPGEWKKQTDETIYIKCIEFKNKDDTTFCKLSSEGPFYQLACSSLPGVAVNLNNLNGSYFCYAKKEVCRDPIPCAILEKVVHQPGADICQHGELKNLRKCEGYGRYRFDHKSLMDEKNKIVDQCCHDNEIFSRPGVSL